MSIAIPTHFFSLVLQEKLSVLQVYQRWDQEVSLNTSDHSFPSNYSIPSPFIESSFDSPSTQVGWVSHGGDLQTAKEYTFDILKDYSEFSFIHAPLPNYLAVHLPKGNLSISSLQKERKRGKFREIRQRANLWIYPSFSRSLPSLDLAGFHTKRISVYQANKESTMLVNRL